jgi:hypothetical protein
MLAAPPRVVLILLAVWVVLVLLGCGRKLHGLPPRRRGESMAPPPSRGGSERSSLSSRSERAGYVDRHLLTHAIEFTKMSGCGNDFILIDNRDGLLDESSAPGARHSASAAGASRWGPTG